MLLIYEEFAPNTFQVLIFLSMWLMVGKSFSLSDPFYSHRSKWEVDIKNIREYYSFDMLAAQICSWI